MAYGTDKDVMSLVYGGPKNTTPAIIGTARQNATSLINGYLNLTSDLDEAPQIVNDACNWIASEFVKNPKTPAKDLLEMADMLLGTIKDQLNQPEPSRWCTLKFV